jgi:hypothetical protein
VRRDALLLMIMRRFSWRMWVPEHGSFHDQLQAWAAVKCCSWAAVIKAGGAFRAAGLHLWMGSSGSWCWSWWCCLRCRDFAWWRKPLEQVLPPLAVFGAWWLVDSSRGVCDEREVV